MDFTSRMLRLLEAVRRERNGLAADTMRCYGARCGLNYGVSLPALRKIARAEPSDHEFARYLSLQDVRELQLAALWIADPVQIVGNEADFWGAKLKNSELAEEAAMALLARTPHIAPLFDAWTRDEAPRLMQYAALLGAARHPQTAGGAVEAGGPAAEVLLEIPCSPEAPSAPRSPEELLSTASPLSQEVPLTSAASLSPEELLSTVLPLSPSASCSPETPLASAAPLSPAELLSTVLPLSPSALHSPAPLSLSLLLERTAGVVRRNPDDRLTAQGAVALFVALAHNDENRRAVFRTIGSLGTSPAADFIHGETAWQLEA